MAEQPTSREPTAQTPKGAWTITFLLFLFMLVNFADKIVVGLAAVPIMTELKLEPSQFGLLGSSFFFLYSISAIVVGFIVNRVQTRWVLTVLAVIWAVAQFPMVGTVGLTTLMVCRIILGAGEGPAFAVATHAVYKWFPDEKRAMPTAILSQGSAFGVIVAVPALNWLIVNHSWHYAFGGLGIVGLLWVAVWIFMAADKVVQRGRSTFIRNVRELHACRQRDQLGRDLIDAAEASRGIGDLARLAAGKREHVAGGFRRDLVRRDEQQRRAGDEGDRDEILADVERHGFLDGGLIVKVDEIRSSV